MCNIMISPQQVTYYIVEIYIQYHDIASRSNIVEIYIQYSVAFILISIPPMGPGDEAVTLCHGSFGLMTVP